MSRVSFISILFLAAACGSPAEQFDSTLIERSGTGAKYSIVRAIDSVPGEVNVITSMSLTDNFLYFAAATVRVGAEIWDKEVTAMTLHRMPKYGGSVERIAEPADSFILGLTTNRESAFWYEAPLNLRASAQGHRVMRRDAASGTNTKMYEGMLAEDLFYRKLKLSKDALFVATIRAPNTSIERLPLAGGPPSPVVTTGNSEQWLLVNDDLYFSSQELPRLTVSTLPIGGGTRRNLVEFPGGNQGGMIASDDLSIYLSIKDRLAPTPGQIVKMDRRSGAVLNLYTSGSTHERLNGASVVDDENLYFIATADTATFRSVPKSGGTSTVLAEEAMNPPRAAVIWAAEGLQKIEQDEKNFFLLYEGREVLLLPKPGAPTS